MDSAGYRHWLLALFILVAVSLTSVNLIVTVTKTISYPRTAAGAGGQEDHDFVRAGQSHRL
jgi:hypothetical protein